MIHSYICPYGGCYKFAMQNSKKIIWRGSVSLQNTVYSFSVLTSHLSAHGQSTWYATELKFRICPCNFCSLFLL